MIRQTLHNERLKPIRGLGVVLAIAGALAAGSMLLGWLSRWIGSISMALFIAYGVGVALFVLNRYVKGYSYEASADMLRVQHLYGRYCRHMADVWFSRVKRWGAPEDVRSHFPKARVNRATRRGVSLAPFAMAYLTDDKVEILIIQPDAAMRAHLEKALKKR